MNRIINALAQLNTLEVSTLVNFILALVVYRVWRDLRETERKNREEE